MRKNGSESGVEVALTDRRASFRLFSPTVDSNPVVIGVQQVWQAHLTWVGHATIGILVSCSVSRAEQKHATGVSLLRDYVRLNAKGKCPPRNLLCYQTTIWSTSVEMAT